MDYEQLAIRLVKKYGHSGRHGYSFTVESVADKMIMAHRLYKEGIGTLKGFLIHCGRQHLRRLICDSYGKSRMIELDARTEQTNNSICDRPDFPPTPGKRTQKKQTRRVSFTHQQIKQPVEIAIKNEALSYLTNKDMFGETSEYISMLLDGYTYEEISKRFKTTSQTISNRIEKAVCVARRRFT